MKFVMTKKYDINFKNKDINYIKLINKISRKFVKGM